jgi:hypothetical protein
LDFFGTWLAWEREEDHKGKDAALSWKLANELTRECWEMGACDLMVEQLEAIRRLLEQRHCCDGDTTITYYDTTIVTTTIQPDVGGYPTTWGENEEPDDWDDWKQYVCFHAHAYVDYLIESSGTLDDIVGVGTWAVDFLGFIISSITYTPLLGAPVPINFSFVDNITRAMLDALDTLEFDTMASKLEAGRDDIVCALINGTSLEDAVEAAVDNSVLWTIFYSWLDYESTKATIYTGEVPGYGYLPPSQRDDCECYEQPEGELIPNFTFHTVAAPWTIVSPMTHSPATSGDYDGYVGPSDNDYPTSYSELISDTFTMPAGENKLHIRVKARGGNHANYATNRTFVIVKTYRVSDNQLMDTTSSEHSGDEVWSVDYQDNNPHDLAAGVEYYVKVAFDGVDGYQRYIDYVSGKVA